MPLIQFLKNQPPIKVEKGSNLMQALLAAGLPVASSCLGDGICARCRIQIVQGQENLSAINGREKILRERNRLGADVRISCQTEVHGDVTVDTAYW